MSDLDLVKNNSEMSVLGATLAQQAVAEVQASMMLARAFPRNELECLDKIKISCQRKKLAESAIYAYARGGSQIQGASIRLAEEIKRIWGHLDSGWRVLESNLEESKVEAYCRDYQSGTIERRVWVVKHERASRGSTVKLRDARDIYELIANQASRRVRACILAMIPSDVVEEALEQCEITLKATTEVSPESISKMIDAFAEFGVSKKQIEARIQRKIDSMTTANMLALKKIYMSLRDGMSVNSDWFEAEQVQTDEKKTAKSLILQAVKKEEVKEVKEEIPSV